MTERLLTTREVAEHYRVTERTIRNWVRSGRLRPKRTPTGRLRFPEDQLDAPSAMCIDRCEFDDGPMIDLAWREVIGG